MLVFALLVSNYPQCVNNNPGHVPGWGVFPKALVQRAERGRAGPQVEEKMARQGCGMS